MCSQLHTMHLHTCAVRPLSHRTSVKKQRIVSHEEYTTCRFHAKNSASVRFCKNFASNVGHVKHYCPFTQSSFCNISQTLRKYINPSKKFCNSSLRGNISLVASSSYVNVVSLESLIIPLYNDVSFVMLMQSWNMQQGQK